MNPYRSFRAPNLSRQRGVALFFALVLLLVLTLLGLAAMQVATLQDRMAGSYRTSNLALQAAESNAREVEIQIARGAVPAFCATESAVFAAAADPSVTPTVCVKTIDIAGGTSGGSMGIEPPGSSAAARAYLITSQGRDRATAAESSSVAVVETVFRF
ncbi:pilus assembly PilX family protein [Arenimonas oryziterrae]|uniref:Type 4 fimbrial biogenesis protein PilX N-terminal domain-containing protein n=1 Tax=Arenimonas oryziterrae DSM 21050 = YC6267 TaxID=1121015 RepID=A0A091AXE7_9GAMM|nr:PilX N-terminal domain-containing pilus assembly protein [Arenimonas oryziterrae]KFN44963.1 hypothetical protein N789_02795 [Arenimonas oryziterrae DSM 21050 = YC6267]